MTQLPGFEALLGSLPRRSQFEIGDQNRMDKPGWTRSERSLQDQSSTCGLYGRRIVSSVGPAEKEPTSTGGILSSGHRSNQINADPSSSRVQQRQHQTREDQKRYSNKPNSATAECTGSSSENHRDAERNRRSKTKSYLEDLQWLLPEDLVRKYASNTPKKEITKNDTLMLAIIRMEALEEVLSECETSYLGRDSNTGSHDSEDDFQTTYNTLSSLSHRVFPEGADRPSNGQAKYVFVPSTPSLKRAPTSHELKGKVFRRMCEKLPHKEKLKKRQPYSVKGKQNIPTR